MQPVAPHHNFFFGHLLLVRRFMQDKPPDASPVYAVGEICQRFFAQQGICYLDLWPLGEQVAVITSPALAEQATTTNAALAAERPQRLVSRFFRPLTGGPCLFDMPERQWKPWRAIFNKSFGPAFAVAQVPSLVDDTLVFCETLRQYARNDEVLVLSDVTRRLAMDFVGHTAL